MDKEELIQAVSMETGRIVAQDKIAVVLSKAVEIVDRTLVSGEPVPQVYYLKTDNKKAINIWDIKKIRFVMRIYIQIIPLNIFHYPQKDGKVNFKGKLFCQLICIRYSLGVCPTTFLNSRVKCCGYWNPNS